ncbi:leucine-rich repeat domain-containing protein [Microscilla marina]|uniref:Cytoplasmic membrane protein n=1 Tax=Microscilla marina ATCC 23134 TaxID=313606 RepID=A1ZG36_MICM2|nr:leucine-rich repeat domain-containing protein [Microscilla marina]EAY30453.1 cytoplasmic membrane protein [Microscilla marina ATCC 23134]
MEDHNKKILSLLKTKDAHNIALAFQLCLGKNGEYNEKVTKELRKYPISCIKNNVEMEFIKQVDAIEIYDNELYFLKPGNNKNTKPLSTADGHSLKIMVNPFPPELFAFTGLKSLFLIQRQITHIPPEIEQLKSLEVLNLSDNSIETVPPEIGNLDQLQNLDLSYNKIKSLPEEMAKLTELSELNLRSNKLYSDDLSVSGALQKLKVLDIAYNEVQFLPFQLKLKKLKKVIVSGNPMSPKEVEFIRQLSGKCKIIDEDEFFL